MDHQVTKAATGKPKPPMSLSDDQGEAIGKVLDWWERGEKQTFSLAGYAGTGKTTVISKLIDEWEGRVLVAAPTGKAAQRLREKGVTATTIHMMAYRLNDEESTEDDPVFDYKGIGAKDALVIIDEASMVNQRIHDDLVGSGYRMLFVGDHGQLAPVGGDPGLMRHPDYTLSKIHRQDDEGLLAFAHALREGNPRPEAHGAVEKHWISPVKSDGCEITWRKLKAADNVICWRNVTRHWLNHRLAIENDLIEPDVKDDRDEMLAALEGKSFPVVCLRTNYKHGVFNGQVFNFYADRVHSDRVFGYLISTSGEKRPVWMDSMGFKSTRGSSPKQGLLWFDFGFCLTAHKSQGSEWDRVCVYDDTSSRMDERARWQYTAATRAAKRLDWLYR